MKQSENKLKVQDSNPASKFMKLASQAAGRIQQAKMKKKGGKC